MLHKYANIDQLLNMTAKLMYFMANLILVKRGNAGVMQWILHALARSKSIALPPFKNHEISWNFKAITSTEPTFTKW